MAGLYPSWLEIPAADLDRAITFYCAVFAIEDPPNAIALSAYEPGEDQAS